MTDFAEEVRLRLRKVWPLRYFRKSFYNVKEERDSSNLPVRGIVLVCRLPVADNYRPRISNYIGIFNACLLERVLTESAMSLLHEIQKKAKQNKLKLYVCCRGAKATTDVVSLWLSNPPPYTPFRQSWWPKNVEQVKARLQSLQRKCLTLMPTFMANSYAQAGEIVVQSDQHLMAEDSKIARKNDPIAGIVQQELKVDRSKQITFLPSVGQTQSEMLEECLRYTINDGCQQTIFINLHAPAITSDILDKAFWTLHDGVDVVLGRSATRGCYLAGFRVEPFLRQPMKLKGIFSYVLWGSRNVYSMLCTNCSSRGRQLNVASLRPILGEIDSVGDLYLVESYIGLPVPRLASTVISVIVPVLNEENVAVKNVECLMQKFSGRYGQLEVIVVDGRSSDNTVRQFMELRNTDMAKINATASIQIKVYRLPEHETPGWANQLEFGLNQASGAYYLFLHADTKLAPKWDEAIVLCLNRPGIVAGVFNYMAAVPNEYVWRRHLRWSLYAHVLNFVRSLCTLKWGHTVGEQGLFMHAFYFRLMGGVAGLGIRNLPGGSGAARLCLPHGSVAVSSLTASSLPRRWTRRSLLYGLVIEALMVIGKAVGLSNQLITTTHKRCPRVDCEISELR